MKLSKKTFDGTIILRKRKTKEREKERKKERDKERKKI